MICHSRRCRSSRLIAGALLTALLTAFLGSCDLRSEQTVLDTGVLRVVTRNGPTTYYEDKSGPTGYEYDLAQQFADHLGVKLEITAVHSLDELFTALQNNTADIAAAGLTITPERQKKFFFSPSYKSVTQHLIYRADTPRPKVIEDLYGSRITVLAGSSHVEILEGLARTFDQLTWRAATDLETVDLFDMLEDGEIDYTIVDSNDYIVNRGFYPRIKIAFDVGEEGRLAWMVAESPSRRLLMSQLDSFFREVHSNGDLRQLDERFYSHTRHVNQIGSRTFSKAVESKLPNYQAVIEQVANEYELDWRLLAAISYQESHWNPRAKSPTGVRGMMMLTLPTAKDMGIKNRLNTEQSLRGGARYFKQILNRVPENIVEPDRTWLALAAYNVGLGHINDVRKITSAQGKDAGKWADIKEHLPLLRKRRWYKDTEHGYARGDEAVTYVQNIRHYYNLLQWQDLARNRTPPPQQMDQYLPENMPVEINAL